MTSRLIRTDTLGFFYVAGRFFGDTDFNPLDSVPIVWAGSYSAYIAKYDSLGICQWVNFYYGSNMNVMDLFVSPDGRSYIAGNFTGSFLNPVTGETQNTETNDFDMFYSGLDRAGAFVFTKVDGGGSGSYDQINSIAALSDSTVVISGYSNFGIQFQSNWMHSFEVENESQEGFAAKLDSLGEILWLNTTESTSDAAGLDITISQNDEIWMLYTSFDSIRFNDNSGIVTYGENTGQSLFLVIYDEDGGIIKSKDFQDSNQSKYATESVQRDGRFWLFGSFQGSIDLNFGTDQHMLHASNLKYGFISSYDICDETEYFQNYLDLAICDGDSLLFEGDYYYQAGEYVTSYPQPNGCDSIDKLVLSINPIYEWVVDTLICDNLPFQFLGETISKTGNYTEPFSSVDGCDSNRIWHVMFNDIQASFSFGSIYLNSGWSGGTYQWYKCVENEFELIPNANSRGYEPAENGEYAVVSTVGSCLDTSDCYLFESLGVTSTQDSEFLIFPNPTKNRLWFSGDESFVKYVIYSMSGQAMQQGVLNKDFIPLSLENGVYHFQVEQTNGLKSIRTLLIQQ